MCCYTPLFYVLRKYYTYVHSINFVTPCWKGAIVCVIVNIVYAVYLFCKCRYITYSIFLFYDELCKLYLLMIINLAGPCIHFLPVRLLVMTSRLVSFHVYESYKTRPILTAYVFSQCHGLFVIIIVLVINKL